MQELYRNRIQILIEIDGEYVDFSSKVIFPIKFSELLDEQLDEGSLTILYNDYPIIKPLTFVQIIAYNEENPSKTVEKFFMVASDNAEELPVGSGKYKHSLYIIEQTKYLEGFICRSHGYVNSLMRDYTSEAKYIQATVPNENSPKPNENIYKTPVSGTSPFTILSGLSVFSDYLSRLSSYTVAGEDGIILTYPNGTTENISITEGKKFPHLVEGNYSIRYAFAVNAGASGYISLICEYNFLVLYQFDPPDPWNAYTVLERSLYMAETLRYGENLRFSIDPSLKTKLEAIETPEFQFTQSTLREVLQGIGNYLHAEPRLINGNTITFDFYGSDEANEVPLLPYFKKTNSQNIEQYAIGLDSSTNNLVSSINYAQGVIVEPFDGGYKTVRTESLYSRIEDTNMLISTEYPIYEIIKLEYLINEEDDTYVDITPYVFEQHDYIRMSSYEDLYPNSKAYALYYSQGEKNINGLYFKQTNAVSPVFENFAILNILRAVTGNNSLSIESYPKMAFRIAYRPIFNARITQSKQCILGYDKPRYLAYNQSQNIIESQYYGEHLKGVIARMGNIDKTLTYYRWGLADIPKVGTLFYDENDEDYYVSTVAVEVQPYTTKITVGLSKDFNRYSEFIGINSLKRTYEISERQANESNVVYNDYVIIGNAVAVGNDKALFKIDDIVNAIMQPDTTMGKVTTVLARSFDKEGKQLARVCLPVQAVAVGNSAIFVAKYEDNYQAGVQAIYASEGGVSGYYQQGVPYSDYFGNVETLQLGYYDEITSWDTDKAMVLPSIGQVNGESRISTAIDGTDKPILLKKGSTEIPTINYQINFVTNRRNIVIGSAFAKHLPLVSGKQKDHKAKLYILPKRLNKFADKVDLTGATEVTYFQTLGVTTNNEGTQVDFPASLETSATGNAWALVCSETNELLFGENKDMTSNGLKQVFGDLHITIKHKIF